MTERSLVPTQCFFALFSHNLCPLQTLTINGNPRLAYVHSGAITDVPRLAALDLSRNALFALESALPARFPASSKLAQSFSSPSSMAQPIVTIVIPLSRAVGFPRSNSQSNLRNALPSEFDFTDENCLRLSDPGSQGPLPVGQLLPLPLRPPVDLGTGVPRRRRPPGQRPHHVPPGKPGRQG